MDCHTLDEGQLLKLQQFKPDRRSDSLRQHVEALFMCGVWFGGFTVVGGVPRVM